jgi:hypothetical protein
MLTRIATFAALGSLLLATPALADRAGNAPVKAPGTVKSHHVAFTLPGDAWVQEVGAFGGDFGHYRLTTTVAGGGECTVTATVIAKWRVGPLASKRGRVRLSADDELVVRRQGRHGAVRWWSGRRGNYAAALGSQRLPARLATGKRRHLEHRVTIQNFAAQPQDHDACLALAHTVSVRVAKTLRVVSGPPTVSEPLIDVRAPS